MKYLMFVSLVLFICFLLFIEPITYFFWSAILLGATHPLEVLVVCSLITFILVVLIGRPMKKSPKGPYRDWDNTLAIYTLPLYFFETILSYTKYPSMGRPPYTNSLFRSQVWWVYFFIFLLKRLEMWIIFRTLVE